VSGRADAPCPYHAAGRWARERFGCGIFRVVVDAGFSCPNRDGALARDGCLFCSIDGFRPPTSRPHLTVSAQIARALPVLRRRYPRAGGYLVYFQPYTNTYGPPEKLDAALAEARAAEGALGVVVGTRPDALGDETCDLLAAFARESFLQVEIGVQSTDDAVLARMRRGHAWEDARRAIARCRARGLRVGAHMILGTPWESVESQWSGAALLSAAGIDAVKLHHLQVIRGSVLAREWEGSPEPLPGWRDYALIAAGFLERLAPRVVVERLCATTRPGMLIAPQWAAGADRVRAEIRRVLIERGSSQGAVAAGP